MTNLVPTGDGQEASFNPRIRCWSEDRVKLTQVGRDQVIANQVGEYLGWERFVEHVRGVLDATGPHSIVSMSLQAIDRMEVSASGFTLGQYFNCDGQFIPRWYADCAVACDITLGRGLVPVDGHNRVIKLQLRTQDDKRSVRIDSTFHDAVKGADPFRKLDELHEECTSAFEQLVTDETRTVVMGGKVS